MKKTRKVLLSIGIYIFLGILSSVFGYKVIAQTVTPTPTDTSVNWPQPCQDKGVTGQDCVNLLSDELSGLKGQEQTLSSQIAVMDSQIQLTQARIYNTQQQINSLTLDIDTAANKITSLQGSLDQLTKILVNRVVATYEVGSIQPIQILLTSSSASDFLQRANYLRIAQSHDRQVLFDTYQAKTDYQNQKQILEDKKKQVVALQQQLQDYTDQLNQEKQSKQVLLTQTQGNETTYQSLLAQAKAELAALSNFANNRVGVGGSIIPHQSISDSFGPYYNQRDANWGNNYIGNSGYQIWEVGCLLTSYAMVSSHYGSTITPDQVASNPNNFALGTAEFDAPGPAPAGHSVSYVTNPSISELQNDLGNGDIIIAGLSANGGPFPQHYSDHWVVLRSVDGSSFRINDPWYPGANNVLLSDNYSGWTIIEARIYH